MIIVQKQFNSPIFTEIKISNLIVESDLSAVNPKDCMKITIPIWIEEKKFEFKTALCKAAEIKNGSGVNFKSYYWDGISNTWTSKKAVEAVAKEQFTKIINLQQSEA